MKSKNLIIIVCVIITFFIGRHSLFFAHSALGTVSSYILYPVLKVQQLIIEPIQFWLKRRLVMSELQKSYTALQKSCEALLSENIALQSTLYHMKDVEELSTFKARYHQKDTIIAQILARHLSEQNQFFLVNAGTHQGIKKDMVALYQNCLIGRVVEVYPWYCKVCLVTDNECKVAALCSKTGASGILEGINNVEKMSLRYVSHLNKVEKDDLIISSGEGLIFPNGFGLGKIVHVNKEALFYTIDVKPIVDVRSLRYCILIAKGEIEGGTM